MTEIELKFQVPPVRAEAVAAAVAGRTAPVVQRLQAAYFDTASRDLARAGIALRLRREGHRWVQTLKAGSGDPLLRHEHNVERPGRGATPPPLEPALHDGTPAGTRLHEVIAAGEGAALHCQYRTDVRRGLRVIRSRGAVLELAFDRGRIVAGDRSLPLCELEIELQRGDPAVLLAAARGWVQRHGLWLDTRSKAERGTLLAAGESRAPARKARPVVLARQAGLPEARRVVLAECLQQVAVNASQVASGDFGDEHVHQLRVGLRRLRTALRLFDAGSEDAATQSLAEPAAALFRALGAARDAAAVAGPLQAQLAQALASTGLALQPPALPLGELQDPAALVHSSTVQVWLLDLMAQTLPGAEEPDPEPARGHVEARLNRWHRQVAAAADRFDSLDDEARHRLRKRVKRLRYGVEFAQGLWGAKKVGRYLRALSALQERLGALNDVGVALARLREAEPRDAATLFALGWLAARRAALIADCAPALQAFADVRRPWRR